MTYDDGHRLAYGSAGKTGVKLEAFALERWMTTWETSVRYDIAESGILPLTARELLNLSGAGAREAALERLLDLPLGYSEAPGSLELRTLLAETYRATGPEDILVTTGAIEANFLLFNVLLSPGDHVVCVAPAYQQLHSVPRALDCEVALWQLRPEDGFRYDLHELGRLITPRTRLIAVNTPHNPTGAMLAADDLRRVYEMARDCGAWLLCDEAYRWLELEGGDPLAGPARDLGEGAISVGTLSKPLGLPGLRVGWMAAPAGLVRECWAMRDYISLSPGKLNDALAVLALRGREQLVARARRISSQNLARARQWVAEHGDLVSWTPPRGGLLALLRYRAPIPSRELADLLAAHYSVMLAPGSAFGLEGYLRLGLGQDPAVFAEGLARTAACLRTLPGGSGSPR
jgi:aspartate/methionine/tyrosine aminotransferase